METNKNDKLRKNLNTNILLSVGISFMLIITIAFATITYAWVFSSEFYGISGVNIELGKSQGLVMIINGNVLETININTYLGGSFSTFSLKEASSDNGRDLHLRDSGMYYDDEENIYDNVDIARDGVGIIQFREANASDHNVSFLYFNLLLEATGQNRYLVFNADESYIKDIEGNLLYPIRISLTFVEGENIDTKIIGNRQEYVGNYHTKPVGEIDSVTKVGYNSTQNVETFNGYTGYENGEFNPEKTLYHFQENVPVNVIVRIWLEGGDPLCTNSIAGSFLNISLLFDNIAEEEVN